MIISGVDTKSNGNDSSYVERKIFMILRAAVTEAQEN